MEHRSEEDQERKLAFWRTHVEAWKRGDLSQRDYCALHGLSRKNFSNWRGAIKYQDVLEERKAQARKRRRKKAVHMNGHMNDHMNGPVMKAPEPALTELTSSGQRVFTEDGKRRIVDESCQPGMSVGRVARRYGVSPRAVFKWRAARGLGPKAAFAPVEIMAETDLPSMSGLTPQGPSSPPSIIIERPTAGIEIELVGGRKVRFERDIDPETVRRMLAVLEGSTP